MCRIIVGSIRGNVFLTEIFDRVENVHFEIQYDCAILKKQKFRKYKIVERDL